MLNDLLFSFNCVTPYFLLIIIGVILRKSGLIPPEFFKSANVFTFKIALPLQLFCTISDIEEDGSGGVKASFLLYVFIVTLISFAVIWIATELIYKDKSIIGTLVQGAFRGNFVLLGVPLAGAALGPAAARTAAFTSIIVVPLYNILSVIVLTLRGKSEKRLTFSDVFRGIITNPLIIGICAAIPFMLLGVKLPEAIGRTMNYLAQTATPLGLLSAGGMLVFADAAARIRPSLYASFIKVFLIPAVVMAASVFIGYRNEELMVMLALSGAPAAVGSYAMAAQMGGDAPLASNILILTTFLSAFVLAAGIYILRIFAFI